MDAKSRARACHARMYERDAASQAAGITVEVPEAGVAIAAMAVTDRFLNGFGLCHGGHVFTLADTAFAFACNAYDDVTVAAAASIEFLRPAKAGDQLTATARERSRGRRSGVYDVEVRNQRNELVALFRGRGHATGRSLLEPDT